MLFLKRQERMEWAWSCIGAQFSPLPPLQWEGRQNTLLHFSHCILLLVCLFPTDYEPLKSNKSKRLVHLVVGMFILFVFSSTMPDTQQACNKCLNEQMKILC